MAKLAGVTARTLRHYDAVGLLEPAATGHGGIRRYGRAELLRLQQILLLRRLGLRLETIGDILDGGLDPVAALRHHADHLQAERDRIDRLAATVDATIRQLEGGGPMAPETWFDGLDAAQQAEFEAEARRRWGDEAVDAGDAAIKQMEPTERAAIPGRFEDLHRRLGALLASGEDPEAEAVQRIADEHYRFIARLWGTEPTAEAYRGLGELYTDDPAFTATYDRVAAGLARFLRAAMDHYAQANL
ncbi:MerR family transcriptional regulator [Glycomyces xiaoerkulensis]|uniref:MerR family transcriptional regulator n=1 Tax=Glycomyces xiaoerkulensis TaxID=2038139 RepID=UPI001E4AF64A|nr:TipAS antibiotic-recognition domain-containing protein [Glycomyces xiaoerkulensis]